LSAAGGQPATTSLERPFRFNNYNTCPPKAPLLPGRPGLIEILGPIMHRSMQGLQEFMRQNCNIVNLCVWNVPMAASMGYVMIKVGDLFFDPRGIMPWILQEGNDEDSNTNLIDHLLKDIGWGEFAKRVGETVDSWAKWVEDFVCIVLNSQTPTWWQVALYIIAGVIGLILSKPGVTTIMGAMEWSVGGAVAAYLGILGTVFLALWLLFGGYKRISEWWDRRPWK